MYRDTSYRLYDLELHMHAYCVLGIREASATSRDL
jgi:hypothetical protein